MSRFVPHIAATLSLGLPLIGSHLARMGIHVSDTVMLGWYGVDALAALVIATSMIHILFFLGMGYGTGVMGLIATAIARGDMRALIQAVATEPDEVRGRIQETVRRLRVVTVEGR